MINNITNFSYNLIYAKYNIENPSKEIELFNNRFIGLSEDDYFFIINGKIIKLLLKEEEYRFYYKFESKREHSVIICLKKPLIDIGQMFIKLKI